MNPWTYILAGYLVTAAGVLFYLFSLNRRKRTLNTQGDVIRRQLKDVVR